MKEAELLTGEVARRLCRVTSSLVSASSHPPPVAAIMALSNISFSVPPGSTTALVGETGSGKSTISRLLFRFYEADVGGVFVGGQNVLQLTQLSLRHHLGMVPQDHALFNDTLEYNVHYGDLGKPLSAVTLL